MRLRIGQDISIQTLDYEEAIFMNGVKISLYPAGHIIGSAQVRLEYKDEIWVISGNYKVFKDGVLYPFVFRAHANKNWKDELNSENHGSALLVMVC